MKIFFFIVFHLVFHLTSLLIFEIKYYHDYDKVFNIKTDFGAKGDGIADDNIAFHKASLAINKRGGDCILIIPKGVYRIGMQKSSYLTYYKFGVNVIDLKKVKNVKIIGSPGAQLLYRDSLRYGYFNKDGGRYNGNSIKTYIAAGKTAMIGSCVSIDSCFNVEVKNISLNGNLYPGKYIIGGRGFYNIQVPFYGVYINRSGNIKLNNVKSERFGLDGFYIISDDKVTNQYNIRLNKCIADYNSRQGISITGGKNIYIDNSCFENTSQGYVKSPPGSGLDIELEHKGIGLDNLVFNNCKFVSNKNVAVLCKYGNDMAKNITFKNCEIVGNSMWSYAICISRHKNIKFVDCKIYGMIQDQGNNAADSTEGVSYTNCHFYDKYNNKIIWDAKQPYEALFKANNVSYLLLKNCRFDVFAKKIWNISSTRKNTTMISGCIAKSYSKFSNNTAIDSNITIKNSSIIYAGKKNNVIHKSSILIDVKTLSK